MLAVLVLDWAFSQLYVRLDSSHLVASDPEAIYREAAPPGGRGLDDDDDESLPRGAGNYAEYDAYFAAEASRAAEDAYGLGGAAADGEDELGEGAADVDVDGDHDEL